MWKYSIDRYSVAQIYLSIPLLFFGSHLFFSSLFISSNAFSDEPDSSLVDITQGLPYPYFGKSSSENGGSHFKDSSDQEFEDKLIERRALAYCLDKEFKALVFFKTRDINYSDEKYRKVVILENGEEAEEVATQVLGLESGIFGKEIPRDPKYPNSKLRLFEIGYEEYNNTIFPNSVFDQIICSKLEPSVLKTLTSWKKFAQSDGEAGTALVNSLLEKQIKHLQIDSLQAELRLYLQTVSLDKLVIRDQNGHLQLPDVQYYEFEIKARKYLKFLKEFSSLDSSQNQMVYDLLDFYQRVLQKAFPSNDKSKSDLTLDFFNSYFISDAIAALSFILESKANYSSFEKIGVFLKTAFLPHRIGSGFSGLMYTLTSNPRITRETQEVVLRLCIDSDLEVMISPIHRLSANPRIHPDIQQKFIDLAPTSPVWIRLEMLIALLKNPGVADDRKKAICEFNTVRSHWVTLIRAVKGSQEESRRENQNRDSFFRRSRRVTSEMIESEKRHKEAEERNYQNLLKEINEIEKICGYRPWYNYL